MSFSTDAGRLLGPGRSADILVYIHRRGGCMLSYVYRDVTRNAHTRDRIDEMEERGLLEISTMGRGTRLSLTPKGERVAEMLESVEEELAESQSSGNRPHPYRRIRCSDFNRHRLSWMSEES